MSPTPWLPRVIVALLATSRAVAGPVGGVAGADSRAAVPGDAVVQIDSPTPANDTIQHEDPREASGEGDLDAVKGWLAGRMSVELEDCVVRVGLGERDVCEYSDEYPDWLGKYVDVAEDTRGEGDDEAAEAFDAATGDTRDYAESVSAFRETYAAYREARQAGDRERARRLARALQRQGAAVDATGRRLVDEFTVVEGETGVDLGNARTSVNETRANATATVEEIEGEQFVATELSASMTPRAISFLEPGTVTGRLAAENGSPVADRQIVLRVGERRFQRRTDDEGRFSVEYRPTTLPVATESLPVRYVPRNESVYLGSNATVPVSVTAVEPAVDVAVGPGRAAYGDGVAVSGTVAAGGVGAPGVPVVVTVDGRRVGTVETGPDGGFDLSAAVVAADGPGRVDVTARVAVSDRALATATGTTSLTVTETPTELALEATAAGPSAVDVSGRLATADGAGVEDQRVTIRVNGTAVESLPTGPDGAFSGTVAVPADRRAGGEGMTVAVVATYAGEGTNLEPSSAREAVALPAGGDAPDSGEDALLAAARQNLEVVLGGLLLGLAGAYLVWRRSGPVRDGTAGTSTTGARPSGSESTTTAGQAAVGPLDHARERADADPDTAVMLAYAAVRRSLTAGGHPARRDADTHWEFLAACRGDGFDPGTIDDLAALTEAYEEAAFAPSSVSADRAQRVVESSGRLVA